MSSFPLPPSLLEKQAKTRVNVEKPNFNGRKEMVTSQHYKLGRRCIEYWEICLETCEGRRAKNIPFQISGSLKDSPVSCI